MVAVANGTLQMLSRGLSGCFTSSSKRFFCGDPISIAAASTVSRETGKGLLAVTVFGPTSCWGHTGGTAQRMGVISGSGVPWARDWVWSWARVWVLWVLAVGVETG